MYACYVYIILLDIYTCVHLGALLTVKNKNLNLLVPNCFHVEEPALLDCCTVWLGNCFPEFRRDMPLSRSGYEFQQ